MTEFNQTQPIENKHYVVWGADNNFTVLQEKSYGVRFMRYPEVKIRGAKGEYCLAQVVISAKTDLTFNVDVFSLQDEGANFFSKNNIKTLIPRYTNVWFNIERFHNYGAGHYPNGIVPFYAIKSKGENVVLAGNNVSLFFSFRIGDDQPAGKYEGTFRLRLGVEDYIDIPVCVEVCDFSIANDYNLRTAFLTDWEWRYGEKNAPLSNYTDYTDVLTEYRLSPYTLLPYKQDANEEDFRLHADMAYEYCLNPRNTTFALPYTVVYADDENLAFNKRNMNLNVETYEQILDALVEKSFATGFNIMKKAVAHFGRLIDEPNGQGTLDRMIKVVTDYENTIKKVSEKILANKAETLAKYNKIDEAFVDDIAADVAHIPHVITAHYDAKYDKWVDQYCPCFWEYQVNERFARYPVHRKERNQKDMWWYGCNGPYSPCPSYHLDDSLLSPLLLSWLQMKHNYNGNLYWAVNAYVWGGPADSKIRDYYNHNFGSDNYGSANGEGLLMYPGHVYGLEKPVASLRLEAIRAGMQDYELWLKLKKAYQAVEKEIGKKVDFESLLDYFMDVMTFGIKIYADIPAYNYSRSCLLDLVGAALGEAKLCVAKTVDLGKSVRLTLVCKKGYTLSANGKELKATESAGEFDLYEVELKGKGGVTVKETGANVGIYPRVSKTFYPVDEDQLKTWHGQNTELLLDQTEIVDIDDGFVKGKYARLRFPFNGNNIQTFFIKDKNFASLDGNAESVLFRFFDPLERFECFKISIKYENCDELENVTSSDTYLAPGGSDMIIGELGRKNWAKRGKIEYIRFDIGEENADHDKERETATIKDYVYYGGYEIIRENI